MTDRFYITTPIYYPNGEPHLGHIYTTLCADTLARYHRLMGHDTYFLTGTDEHGIKMVKTAADQKITPQELADKNVAVFEAVWKELQITNNDFLRTSSDRHKKAVQEIVKKMLESGDIYLGSYEGWYDEGQEEFITETEAKDADFKSRISGRPLVRYSESTYFFKLTKYVEPVTKAIESGAIRVMPQARKNEILSKLKGWDQDLSISRASLKWGIQMPNDPEHVLYVWIDALSNYITALGFPPGGEQFSRYWPVATHLIGKEILWFHAFYWPAMLMSLGLNLPRVLFAHGWWTSGGQKMSKSMGNFIDLEKVRHVVATYSQDALRYYLLRAAAFGNDLDWEDVEFNKSYDELRNVVGNLLNRTLNMIAKYREGIVPAAGEMAEVDKIIAEPLSQLQATLTEAYANCDLQKCVLAPVELARAANAYIDATRPFTLAKDPAKAAELDRALHWIAQACCRVLVGLLPVMPHKAAAGLAQMGVDIAGKTLSQLLATPLAAGHKLGKAEVLFPPIETEKK